MSMSTQPGDPREQVSLLSRVLTMHEMPSSSSTAMTGKDELSKSEKTGTLTLVADFKAVQVDSAVDLEQEVDMEAAMEQEAEALVEEAALADEEATAEGLEVAEGSKVALEVGSVVNKVAGTEVLLKKPPLPILSPTSLQVVANADKSSLCET